MHTHTYTHTHARKRTHKHTQACTECIKEHLGCAAFPLPGVPSAHNTFVHTRPVNMCTASTVHLSCATPPPSWSTKRAHGMRIHMHNPYTRAPHHQWPQPGGAATHPACCLAGCAGAHAHGELLLPIRLGGRQADAHVWRASCLPAAGGRGGGLHTTCQAYDVQCVSVCCGNARLAPFFPQLAAEVGPHASRPSRQSRCAFMCVVIMDVCATSTSSRSGWQQGCEDAHLCLPGRVRAVAVCRVHPSHWQQTH